MLPRVSGIPVPNVRDPFGADAAPFRAVHVLDARVLRFHAFHAVPFRAVHAPRIHVVRAAPCRVVHVRVFRVPDWLLVRFRVVPFPVGGVVPSRVDHVGQVVV